MPNYTTNLNLEKPLQSEQYNIDVFNANADKIDQFAGQTPPYALTADALRVGAKINGVNFKGDTDVVTGAGFYYDTVTYGAGDLAFIYNQNGALELHKSLSAGNVGHNPLTSTGYWEKVELGGSGGRNVGEIITSTLPLTDAGLHLLDGARLSGDGIYGEFVDYIAELYTENPTANYFTDETTWQQSITDYGVCGKFVYDSTNNTVRLPKVTGIIEGTTDVSALGDLVKERLPNIKGSLDTTCSGANGNLPTRVGCMNATETGVMIYAGTGSAYVNNATISVDASLSSSTYQDNAPVQPQTIKCFVYIVIANSTKTDIQVDIDEIATDLNGKADTDLTNTTDLAKILMGSMAMPSETYIDLTLGTSGASYTAPANGWVQLTKIARENNTYIYIEDTENELRTETLEPNSGNYLSCFLPIIKNHSFRVGYTATGETRAFRFIYAVGSESEA